MRGILTSKWGLLAAAVALAVSGVYAAVASAADVTLTLAGDQEVPAVSTAAKGSGMVTIGDDMSVKGTVTTGP
jgi:hypothetical protein